MKQIKIYLFALLAVLSMAACSSDEGDGNRSNEINTNKNEVTTDKAVTRLEFPKLKGGNSIIRVYRDGNSKQYDPDNVNYSVEWDCDKKSQRWSCYIITKKTEPKIQIAITTRITNTPTTLLLPLHKDGRKTIFIVQASTTDTSATPTIACIVPMPTIKLSISPICSRNIASLMEVTQTISMKVYGSRWRTT